jgi:NAD(P)H-binding
MRRNGVRRLLKISVVGAGESVKNAGFFNEHVLMRTFLRLLVDKAGMEAEIEGSNLDWTLVRPPMLTDREKTGVARVLSTEGGEKTHKIGRADLAAFMVQQLESGCMCVRQ